MPKYKTEIFGQFIYSPEISYDELLELEDEIKAFITDTLDSAGAEFLAFESEGDRTFFQCVLQDSDEENSEQIAGRFAARLNNTLECKMMFVNKMLDMHFYYAMNHKGIKLEKIILPPAGPMDRALLAEGQ